MATIDANSTFTIPNRHSFSFQGLIIYEMLSGINPFKVRNKTKFEKLQMITDHKIRMFPVFSANAKDILNGLLTQDVSHSYILFDR